MIQKLFSWIEKHQYAVLASILLFAAITRLWRLGFPDAYYFDEVYHVVTAKLIAYGDPSAYEWWHPAPEPNTAIDWLHPPLAKLFQAVSMILFGFTSFSWRLSSALFGVGVIALTFAVSKKLKLPTVVALLAAFFASTDGLLLTMSRVTMNDIHVTFFYLLTVFCYLGWKDRPTLRLALFTALAAGLAVASKWSGIFVVGLVMGDLLWSQLVPLREQLQKRSVAQLTTLLLLFVPLVYILSYGQMWVQGKTWSHFVELHEQIWWYQSNLEATHPYQSTPLQWIFALRPVYAYTQSAGPESMQNIYFQANPVLLWLGIAAVFFSLGNLAASATLWVQASQKLWRSELGALEKTRLRLGKRLQQLPANTSELFFLLLAFFSTWIVWLFSPRIMFFYHYTPAIPFLAIILALQIWNNRARLPWLLPVVATLLFFTFVLLYPNLTALPVPTEPWYRLYFAIDSWR